MLLPQQPCGVPTQPRGVAPSWIDLDAGVCGDGEPDGAAGGRGAEARGGEEEGSSVRFPIGGGGGGGVPEGDGCRSCGSGRVVEEVDRSGCGGGGGVGAGDWRR